MFNSNPRYLVLKTSIKRFLISPFIKKNLKVLSIFIKVRTRLGADAKYRLTVEELELFVNQLETLPAKVSGQQVGLIDNSIV